MKTKSILKNQWQKKHYTNKQHYARQQTTLSKQALHTALYTTALK